MAIEPSLWGRGSGLAGWADRLFLSSLAGVGTGRGLSVHGCSHEAQPRRKALPPIPTNTKVRTFLAGFWVNVAGFEECGGPIGTRDYERKRENAWGITQERLGGHILRACTLPLCAWEICADKVCVIVSLSSVFGGYGCALQSQ